MNDLEASIFFALDHNMNSNDIFITALSKSDDMSPDVQILFTVK